MRTQHESEMGVFLQFWQDSRNSVERRPALRDSPRLHIGTWQDGESIAEFLCMPRHTLPVLRQPHFAAYRRTWQSGHVTRISRNTGKLFDLPVVRLEVVVRHRPSEHLVKPLTLPEVARSKAGDGSGPVVRKATENEGLVSQGFSV